MCIMNLKNTRQWIFFMISLVSILYFSECRAQEFELLCPETLPIVRGKMAGLPDKWSLSTGEMSFDFFFMAISEGHYYDLRPHEDYLQNGDIFLHWSLSKSRGQDGNSPLYVKCVYTKSYDFLFQQIPNDINQCDYLFRADINLRKLEKLKCSK